MKVGQNPLLLEDARGKLKRAAYKGTRCLGKSFCGSVGSGTGGACAKYLADKKTCLRTACIPGSEEGSETVDGQGHVISCLSPAFCPFRWALKIGKPRKEFVAPKDLPFMFDFTTCAVVGSSASLLRSEFGKEIDAHTFVLRFNQVTERPRGPSHLLIRRAPVFTQGVQVAHPRSISTQPSLWKQIVPCSFFCWLMRPRSAPCRFPPACRDHPFPCM